MPAIRIEQHEGDVPAAAAALRMRVFVEEQGVSVNEEMDGRDAACVHFLAWQEEVPLGCARLRPLEAGRAKVERVAVLAEHRERGLGRRLMDAAEAEALRRGLCQLVLHAQEPVVGFYDRLGWRAVGGVFEEAGIPHREMIKTLG